MTEEIQRPNNDMIMVARRVRLLKAKFLTDHGLNPQWVRLGPKDRELIPDGSTVSGLVVLPGVSEDAEVGLSALEEFSTDTPAF